MKMRKTIMLLCCVIIASMGIFLTGCGGSSEDSSSETKPENQYIGAWEATVITTTEDEVMYDFKENNEVCIFNFNDDYTFKLELAGVEYDGTWELIEGGLMITDTDNKQANIYYKDGELLWTLQEGDIEGTYHFVKKE